MICPYTWGRFFYFTDIFMIKVKTLHKVAFLMNGCARVFSCSCKSRIAAVIENSNRFDQSGICEK